MRWARPLGLVLAVLSFVGAGALLPDLEQRTEDAGLRYTDSVVEGAPPWVAVGTAIGALRGLVVDVLWIKVNLMKEEGDYFEVMALSDLITKLQPRFAAVWAYHGHNMAYNISVATHTLEERWDWVGPVLVWCKTKVCGTTLMTWCCTKNWPFGTPTRSRATRTTPTSSTKESSRESGTSCWGSRPRRWKIASLGCGRLKKPLVLFHSF